MPTVSVLGTELEYVEQGSGEALVFVHGSVNDLRSWGQQFEPFGQRYRVFAYTRRHHHGSEDPAMRRQLSVSDAAKDLVDLIEALGIAPAHLIGSSFGAFTALLAARDRPELARSLVLGEPPVLHLLQSDSATQPISDAFLDRAYNPAHELAKAGDAEGALRAFLDGVIGEGALDIMPPPARQMMVENAYTIRIEQQVDEPFGPADAEKLTMPILLVTGQYTPAMFPVITDKLQALVPRADRVEIADASHGMHGQNPAGYNSAVLDWLARVS